jgi:hypothetical protein
MSNANPLRKAMLVDGPTRFVEVSFDEGGALQFAVQDVGDAPREFFGDSDYEFWLTVPADSVADLAALIHIDPVDPITGLISGWTGEARFSELQTIMQGADYVKFFSW